MKYCSTRDASIVVSFEEALLSGYAPDGGLYVPLNLPRKCITPHLLQLWSRLDYPHLAYSLWRLFISSEEISDDDLYNIICHEAYGKDYIQQDKAMTDDIGNGTNGHNGGGSSSSSSSTTPPSYLMLREMGGPSPSIPSFQVSELWHGPTQCFKDWGVRAVIALLGYFCKKNYQPTTILVATTGDTGPAAVRAVNDYQNPYLQLVVHYPQNQISEYQRRQLVVPKSIIQKKIQQQQKEQQEEGNTVDNINDNSTTTTNSKFVKVVVYEGGGDDMDGPIKTLLTTQQKQSKTVQSNDGKTTKKPTKLTGINSYNIGRPLAQMVHFIWTYLRVVEKMKHQHEQDQKQQQQQQDNDNKNNTTDGSIPQPPTPFVFPMMDVIVPTGAMGNLTAGYMAKQMGLPIGKFIAAVNNNDVTYQIFSTGQFISLPQMKKTMSEAINIQNPPYNLERILFYSTGGQNHNLIKQWMTQYEVTKQQQQQQPPFTLPLDFVQHYLQQEFYSAVISDDEMKDTMKNFYENFQYLIDPHTAVAIAAGIKLGYPTRHHPLPTAVMSTASPCKFQAAVQDAVGIDIWNQYYHQFPISVRILYELSMDEIPNEDALYTTMAGQNLIETQTKWMERTKSIIDDLAQQHGNLPPVYGPPSISADDTNNDTLFVNTTTMPTITTTNDKGMQTIVEVGSEFERSPMNQVTEEQQYQQQQQQQRQQQQEDEEEKEGDFEVATHNQGYTYGQVSIGNEDLSNQFSALGMSGPPGEFSVVQSPPVPPATQEQQEQQPPALTSQPSTEVAPAPVESDPFATLPTPDGTNLYSMTANPVGNDNDPFSSLPAPESTNSYAMSSAPADLVSTPTPAPEVPASSSTLDGYSMSAPNNDLLAPSTFSSDVHDNSATPAPTSSSDVYSSIPAPTSTSWDVHSMPAPNDLPAPSLSSETYSIPPPNEMSSTSSGGYSMPAPNDLPAPASSDSYSMPAPNDLPAPSSMAISSDHPAPTSGSSSMPAPNDLPAPSSLESYSMPGPNDLPAPTSSDSYSMPALGDLSAAAPSSSMATSNDFLAPTTSGSYSMPAPNDLPAPSSSESYSMPAPNEMSAASSGGYSMPAPNDLPAPTSSDPFSMSAPGDLSAAAPPSSMPTSGGYSMNAPNDLPAPASTDSYSMPAPSDLPAPNDLSAPSSGGYSMPAPNDLKASASSENYSMPAPSGLAAPSTFGSTTPSQDLFSLPAPNEITNTNQYSMPPPSEMPTSGNAFSSGNGGFNLPPPDQYSMPGPSATFPGANLPAPTGDFGFGGFGQSQGAQPNTMYSGGGGGSGGPEADPALSLDVGQAPADPVLEVLQSPRDT